ncbi:MAG: hypothetical protein NZ528_06000 [Caldilineales bacterium]|nr:hypothetical protein [Caldilineales bacterium]MDW8319212.1 hypothetical protein [Anaerolineae bacterium]
MARVLHLDLLICDGCGVEIQWAPVVVGARTFCCQDCAEGRPCRCDYPPEEPQAAAEPALVLTTT